MAKKTKGKKSASPLPPPPDMNNADDDLMTDLLAELESRDHTRQVASASILNEMHIQEHATELETVASTKQDAKSRFKARLVRFFFSFMLAIHHSLHYHQIGAQDSPARAVLLSRRSRSAGAPRTRGQRGAGSDNKDRK